VDGDNGVLPVEFAGEHRADFGRIDVARELIEPAREVAGDILALLHPVDENREVVRLSAQGVRERLVAFEAATALQDGLGFLLVFPEVR
jgi:hypothetical protein